MEPISDLTGYNEHMAKSMADKLWFIPMIPGDIANIYDYGCADGTLLKLIHKQRPDLTLYGFDFNPDMLQLAKTNIPCAHFVSKPMPLVPSQSLLNASSVFHEIHSYSTDIEGEYAHIFGCGAQYIAIRDMFYSESAIRHSDPDSVDKLVHLEPDWKLRDFEANHGPITENKNLLHYLLKYRYLANWSREVKENYLPYSLETFLMKIPSEYEVVYCEPYTLPFLKAQVAKDFGIELKDTTHAKILIERRN